MQDRGHPKTLVDLVAVSVLWSDTTTRVAREFKALVEAAGGPCTIGNQRAAADTADILERLARGVCPGAAEARLLVRAARSRARDALDRAVVARVKCLGCHQPEYPDPLWQIPDPPPVLWFLGHADVLRLPAVAMVGARDATPAGLAVATRLATELARTGLTVVSGLARGVDGAAHQGALAGGGPTVAVLGSGADVVYPLQHRDLALQICEAGAIVSEFPPGSQPLPFRFPLRNRIISGLSRAVVVVEASDRSGSLITARAALEQGRDVLAVPGSVASGRYRGGHALIKDGARLVETVEDVLEEIGWPRRPEQKSEEAGNTLHISSLERLMVAGESYSLDALAALTGREAPELLAELTGLELAGRVRRVGSGDFAKA